ADEARRAVAALGAAAVRHLPLHRVQRARRAETLGGDQLLAIQREHRHQARVQCGPEGATLAVGPGHHHRAGTALALRAALLGAGQPLVAQPVERGDVRLDIDHRALFAVDHNAGCRHDAVPSLQVTVLARASSDRCARTADWVSSCSSTVTTWSRSTTVRPPTNSSSSGGAAPSTRAAT